MKALSATSAFVTVTWLVGCALTHERQTDAPAVGTKNSGQSVVTAHGLIDVLDCAVDDGYEVNRIEGLSGSPEVYVLSVYESQRNGAQGEATVNVTRSAPLVLVLSSYEPTHWTVFGDENAHIEQVILSGYHPQSATVDAGVEVIIDRSRAATGVVALSLCGYGDDSGGCDTRSLIAGAEQLSGQPVTELAGCYRASSFVVADLE
jgi:hypothetical protein